jgi:hypothetical protein
MGKFFDPIATRLDLFFQMFSAMIGTNRAIPNVGTFRPCFDRVVIVSSTPVGILKTRLPLQILEEVSHSFNITTYSGQHPRLCSVITVVCAQNHQPLQILAEYKGLLGDHRVVEVEIALDVVADAASGAQEGLAALVGLIVKPHHRRRHLRAVHHPDQTPPPGCTRGPTFYLEDRKSSVKQKAYVRLRKLPGRGFGEEHVRLEWTLSRKRAVVRHVGGNKIEDLLRADLGKFIDRNLRLEQVDHVELGYVLGGIPAKRRKKPQNPPASNRPTMLEQLPDSDYRARWRANMLSHSLANREQTKFANYEQALWVCQHSSAQIRGHLKEMRDEGRPRRRGRPRNVPRRVRRITDYQINSCFRRIKPSRV